MTGPSGHATLSPSSAHRWIQCPGSVRLSVDIETHVDSPAAYEGTVAHALLEIEGRYRWNLIDATEYSRLYEAWRLGSGFDLDHVGEIERHIENCLAFIEERMALYPGSQVMFEKRVDTGVPGSWGTSDVIIVSPEHVEIIDLKYGFNPVHPEGNEQTMLYGLGALAEFDLLGTAETVIMSIYQPRAINGINSHAMDVAELYRWRDEVAIPAAELAMTDDAPLRPSEKACYWCPVAGDCKVRAQFLAGQDFAAPYVEAQAPELLDDTEIAAVLERIPQIRDWCDAIEAAALRRTYTEGRDVPGWKAVKTYGRRFIKDQEKALAELQEQTGFPAERFINTKLKGLGDLEKVVGGQGMLNDLLGDLVGKSEGKPSLVRSKDKRDAIRYDGGVKEDFGE